MISIISIIFSKIETPLENVANFGTFLVNLNTNSQSIKPFYSQCSITNIKDNFKLFAFQTSSTVSLIKCENLNKWSVFAQIDLKDSTVQKQLIAHFEFLPSPSENLDSYTKEMMIGYRNGLILHINYLDNAVINKFNVVNEEGEKLVSVQTILFNPKTHTNFYVLFSNSLLMKYSLEKAPENQAFLEEKSRIVDKKKTIGKNKLKGMVKDNTYEINSHKFEGSPELNFRSGNNMDKVAKNPMNFYYFINCNAISEAVFNQNNFFKKFSVDLIFAFVGYDGYLRIYDLEQNKALYSFKSNFGGFNNLNFNNSGELVVLSGHDDNVVVFNLSNQNYLTIEGHKSFISKVLITDIDDKYIRVYAGSMDGTFSITDINLNDYGLKSYVDNPYIDKKKFPIKIFFNDIKSQRIMAKNINIGNNEGIGSIMFHDPHFLCAGYDGAVSIWSIETEKEKKKEDDEENYDSENGEKDKNKKYNNDEENKRDYYDKKKIYTQTPTKEMNSSNKQMNSSSKKEDSDSGKKKKYNQK